MKPQASENLRFDNVWDALCDTPEQAQNMRLRAELMHGIHQTLTRRGLSQAEAARLCGITATPPHAEIHKTALGAEETVAWRYNKDTLEAVEELRREGYVICALEQAEGSLSLAEFQPERGRKYAVVVGHEVKGVSQGVVDRSDVCIEIPQRGTKHSLNVSVAAGIVLWEFFKGLTPSESLLGSQENLAGIP